MSTNTISRYVLCCFAILGLSACESLKWKEHNVLSSSAGQAQRDVEVNNNMTSMPVSDKSATVNNKEVASDSVEIFDMSLNPNYQRGVAPSLAVSPVVRQPVPPRQVAQTSMTPITGYGGGVRSADSSVTIYSLDGDSIPYPASSQDYGRAYASGDALNYGQAYGQSYAQGYGSVAGQIFFKHGSSRLGSGDMRKITNLAEQAKFAPVNYITVEGFASKPTQVGTDTTQAHIINLRQSMKRSEKVSKALVKKGVPGDKIKTVSWGASKATGNNSRDRRVDIVMGEK